MNYFEYVSRVARLQAFAAAYVQNPISLLRKMLGVLAVCEAPNCGTLTLSLLGGIRDAPARYEDG